MRLSIFSVAIDLGNEDYDAVGLLDELTYTAEIDGYSSYETCDFIIREIVRLDYNGQNAIMIACSIYLAVVLVFMAMAILALKVLSEVPVDKIRYFTLYRIGVGKSELRSTLLRQNFIFFFLPFIVPVLLGIPASVLCVRIIRRRGYISQSGIIYALSASVIMVLVIVYILYFAATYVTSRKNIIDIQE